ncbi:YdbH domain-containing protein [Thermodesulfobacteriota bacterium]
MPRHIEKNFLPALGERFSIPLTGQLHTLGINQASLGDITLGYSNNPILSIGSIHANYSLSSIRDKRIDRLKINGLILSLEFIEKKIIIPGIDLEKIVGTKISPQNSAQPSSVSMPLQLDNLEVDNSYLKITVDDQHILVPFRLQINRKKKSDSQTLPSYRLFLQMEPQGQKTVFSGTVDLANNKGMFEISADSFDMKQFTSLDAGLHENLDFGKASLKGIMTMDLMPFAHVASELDCKFETINFKTLQVGFGVPAGSNNTAKLLHLNIKGDREQPWKIAFTGFMNKPLPASIGLDGSVFTKDGIQSTGDIHFRVTDPKVKLESKTSPAIIKGSPEWDAHFSMDITKEGEWQAAIESPGDKDTMEVVFGKNILMAQSPSFIIDAKSDTDRLQANIKVNIADAHITLPDALEIVLPKAELQGSFNRITGSDLNKTVSGGFTLDVPDMEIQKNSVTGKTSLALNGKIAPQLFNDIKSILITGKLDVRKASMSDSENNISINTITGKVPWQWPRSSRKTGGSLEVSGIRWNSSEIGSFETAITLENSIYTIDGKFTHSLPQGLTTSIRGQTGFADAQFQADFMMHMKNTTFSSLHLGELHSSLINSYMSGELGLQGEIKIDHNGLYGNISTMMQSGRFELPDKKYTIQNISMNFLLPSLPTLRSSPAQQILFDKASIGDLTLEKGKIIWQLESPDSIFIEEGVVRWAGGRIFTNAVRISPERQELVIPIFCDRLKLTELLHEFGITDAEGEGTVSGRIPLLIGKDTIGFEDGFLYSSPGQGGSVRVKAFDMLSTGIPKNSPQFAQVDFAAEALKNFRYNWVKLLFNSEGDDLFMEMQMDGKPVQSLPFSYDTQTGLLQRMQDGTKGIDQPIRLDVNFRLPLNRFLGYSGRIQDIMDKIK